MAEKTAKAWEITIKKLLKAHGTDEKQYKPLISTLADILAERDAVYRQYLEEGAMPVREYTNKAGATNLTKNPLLILWDDLNKSALSYWRELGLTPSAYKKISGDSPKKKESGGLAAALASLGAD